MRPTVTFTGRITTAPETTAAGKGRVCRFSVGTTFRSRDRDTGNTVTEIDLQVCVTYNADLIQVLQKQAFKGRLVTVSGTLTYKRNVHGQNRTAEILIEHGSRIEFLDSIGVDGTIHDAMELVPGPPSAELPQPNRPAAAPPAGAAQAPPPPTAPLRHGDPDDDESWLN